MMPRNISFSHTTDQIRDKTKTVTRRLGWVNLKRGEILNACVKLQGLKKGDKVEKLCQIRVVSVKRERLDDLYYMKGYGPQEMEKEGFPSMSAREFVEMFCKMNLCQPYIFVTRIEFEYVYFEYVR